MNAIAAAVGCLSLCGLAAISGCAGHHAPPGAAADEAFAVVEIRPTLHQSLRDRIIKETASAESRGLAPVLELTSAWDHRCFVVDHSFDDQRMREALRGTYIIRLDIKRWEGRFGDTGLDRIPMAFPGFVEVMASGHGLGPFIDARSWIADSPTAVAPSLSAFVHSFVER
jgi:hypothetical protein